WQCGDGVRCLCIDRWNKAIRKQTLQPEKANIRTSFLSHFDSPSTRTDTHTHADTQIHAHKHTLAHTQTHKYAHTSTHSHTHTHTASHTHAPAWGWVTPHL